MVEKSRVGGAGTTDATPATQDHLGLIIGESTIARLLFGDTKQRRKVRKLIGVLPIFDLNGKPAALTSQLSADIIARARAAVVPPLSASAKRHEHAETQAKRKAETQAKLKAKNNTTRR